MWFATDAVWLHRIIPIYVTPEINTFICSLYIYGCHNYVPWGRNLPKKVFTGFLNSGKCLCNLMHY